jgi:hypothetical protein
MEQRRSVSDEEADGLLYAVDGPRHGLDGPRWQRKHVLKSKLVRVIGIFAALGVLFLLFAPSASTATIPQTAPTPLEQTETEGVSTEDNINGTCNFASCLTKRFTFTNIKDFTLRNLIEPTQRGDVFHNSWVRLAPGVIDQKEDIVVDFSFNTTDPGLSSLLDIQSTPNSLIILFPRSQPPPQADSSRPRERIETQTKVFFRAGLKLDQITLDSTVLGINIPAPIDIWATTANLTCTAGSLYVDPLFDARYAFITMDAGSVAGTFPLFEVLALESDAGTMNAEIIPQKAALKHHLHVAPASLIIQSSAGNVDVRYNTRNGLPERDYTVNVHSDFGRITGKYVHGSYTSLKTSMGEIVASILPMASDRDESELVTYTHAGRQQITVLDPYYDRAVRLARMDSSHESKLGSVEVIYPKRWEGTVEAVSKMGSVDVGGKDLQIIREQKSILGGLIEAEKGQGEGSTVCATERGNVKFTVAG